MEKDTESPETRALIRRAGAEGTVLLKNTGILPLSREARVAVIGPNAATAHDLRGGGAQMNAYRRVSPLTGLQDTQGSENVTYALGGVRERQTAARSPGASAHPSGAELSAGFTGSGRVAGLR